MMMLSSFKVALMVLGVVVVAFIAPIAVSDVGIEQYAKVCEFAKAEIFHNSVEVDCTSAFLVCTKMSSVFGCDDFKTTIVSLDLSQKNLTAIPVEIGLIETLLHL